MRQADLAPRSSRSTRASIRTRATRRCARASSDASRPWRPARPCACACPSGPQRTAVAVPVSALAQRARRRSRVRARDRQARQDARARAPGAAPARCSATRSSSSTGSPPASRSRPQARSSCATRCSSRSPTGASRRAAHARLRASRALGGNQKLRRQQHALDHRHLHQAPGARDRGQPRARARRLARDLGAAGAAVPADRELVGRHHDHVLRRQRRDGARLPDDADRARGVRDRRRRLHRVDAAAPASARSPCA